MSLITLRSKKHWQIVEYFMYKIKSLQKLMEKNKQLIYSVVDCVCVICFTLYYPNKVVLCRSRTAAAFYLHNDLKQKSIVSLCQHMWSAGIIKTVT